MNRYAHIVIGFLFVVEVGAFGFAYLFGPYSVSRIRTLEREHEKIEQANQRMITEVANLEHEIVAWQEDDFFREKIAREQLQMVHDGDEVYYLT